MKNLMIDIETLGTKPGSVIASIGAVFFDPATGETGAEFEALISVEDSKRIGFTTDSATLELWSKQSAAAQAQLQGSLSPELALDDFLQFVISHCERKSVKVWGNGAGFDPVLLESAYDICNEAFGINVEPPFKYWNVRDVRTMVELGRQVGFDPKQEVPFDVIPHSALADAKHQAKYVSAIWKRLIPFGFGTEVVKPPLTYDEREEVYQKLLAIGGSCATRLVNRLRGSSEWTWLTDEGIKRQYSGLGTNSIQLLRTVYPYRGRK